MKQRTPEKRCCHQSNLFKTWGKTPQYKRFCPIDDELVLFDDKGWYLVEAQVTDRSDQKPDLSENDCKLRNSEEPEQGFEKHTTSETEKLCKQLN